MESTTVKAIRAFTRGEITASQLREWCGRVLDGKPLLPPLDWQKINRVAIDLLRKHGKEGARFKLQNWLNRCIQAGNESCVRQCEGCLWIVEQVEIE